MPAKHEGNVFQFLSLTVKQSIKFHNIYIYIHWQIPQISENGFNYSIWLAKHSAPHQWQCRQTRVEK